MSERERLHRPELAERPVAEARRSPRSDGVAPDHARREAQLWRDLGAARAPNDLEDAATLAVEKRGEGQPVPADLAALVRADTGVDVSGARFHKDPLSQKTVHAMRARAFAYGNDIFLGPGESEHDQALMAHELTHVAQQRGATPAPQRKVAVGAEGSAAEQHADQVAAQVTAGASAVQQLLVDGGTLAPGQMLKSSFLERLRPFVTAAADAELGMIGSAVACPYIAQYFAKYAALPAKSTVTLIQRWVPEARTATGAEALVPLLVARVRAGVQYWKQTHKLPPELAAADPAAAQAAETNQAPRSASDAQPIVNRKSLDGMEAELGPGRSLDHATAQRMSAVVGADVSGAKIHTGPTAAGMASEHGAAAFAVGQNVVMGSSAPTSGVAGDALLAHELAHTAQQADAHKDPDARRQPIGAEDQGAERDAGLERLGNFAGAVGDVMRTGLQLQRCQAGTVDPGPTTQAYYEQYLVQIAAGAADQLRALPFATYDDTVTWTAAGVTQFPTAMAAQITAKTDLDSLVRPELIGKLVAESRVVTEVEPASVDGGSPVSKGPDSYFPSVGTEVGNALARRIAESLQREIPRYAQAKIANGKEPGPDDVLVSHPIDPLVITALAKGNMVGIDQVKFKERHPELAGPPKLLNSSQNIQLEDVKDLPGWHRLISPATATPEEIVLALGLPSTESFRLQVAHPLYGLEDDTRGTFAEVENPIGRAAQLARSNGPEAAEAALSQAGPIDPKDARPRERILEEMRVNANVLRSSIAPIAQQFQLEEKVITAATMIEHRVSQLETQDDGDVAKWDAQSKKQSDIISRAGAGLAGDGARLDAYKAANKDSADKGTTDGLPPDHPLRQDAEMWANALLSCDLVDSAAQMIAAASRHTLTLEIEILERGLSTPQSASYQASDTTDAKQDFDTDGMGKREIEERKQLGQLRAQMMSQMLGDPSKADPKAAGTTQDARNLIFESQVAAQAAQLEHEWTSLDQAVDSWTTLGGDRRDATALKVRAKDYYAQWKAIYALIKKGEAGDKKAMDKARTDFETLAADTKFQGFLKEVQDELKTIHEDQMIVMIIAMVAITLVSMGAGSALSATLGGTALVVDGTEVVVGGIGVARNTAAVAGFLAETATFTVLSNVAFSRDHSIGALLSDFAKNLVMFGAMRGVGMGVKALGLSRLFKAGEEAGKLAKFAATAGDAIGQSMINSGIGIMTGWVEAKVKQMFGAKPMTEQEQHDAIIMAVSQAVIFSIGGRLMESPIKKLEVSAAFAGKKWQLALDGWATERKANLVMQDRVTRGGKVSAADVIEAAHRDQAQIDKEMDALEALKDAANNDKKGAKAQGINGDVLDKQMKTLNDLRANSLGAEMAMTMKQRGPNFFEAGAAEVARMRALETAEGATVVPEGERDPGTGAQTWRITPKGDNATPILVAEAVPDWAITPTGKQIVEVARRAKLDDAQIYSLTEQQRTALLALKNAVEQNNAADIAAARSHLGELSAKDQQAFIDAIDTKGTAPATPDQAATPAVEITPTMDPSAVLTRTNVAIGTKLANESTAQAVLAKLAAGDPAAFQAIGMEAPRHFDTRSVEWGIGEANGEFFIIRGEPGAVDWAGFPGVRAVAHSHPLTAGKMIKGGSTSFGELVQGGGRNGELNKVNVFPSAADVAFCARNKLAEHTVQTPYASKGGDRIGNPTPGAKEPLVQIKILQPERIGSWAGNKNVGVFKSRMIATDEHGNFVWSGDVYTVDHEALGSVVIFNEPPAGLVTGDEAGLAGPTDLQTKAGNIPPGDATRIFDTANSHSGRELAKYQDIPPDAAVRVREATRAAGVATYDSEMAKPGAKSDTAIKLAGKAADKAAKAAAKNEAQTAATNRATTEMASRKAFKGPTTDLKNRLTNYDSGTAGGAAKRLASQLDGKTQAEMEALLDLEVAGGAATRAIDPTKDPTDPTKMQDQVAYDFTDGTLIRIKPKGDKNNNPGKLTYSVEVKTATPASDQAGVSFKVDIQGDPVPKGPDDVRGEQTDRLLGNPGIDVWTLFRPWAQFVVAERKEIVVALDWTEFDGDDHATLAGYLITSHGRATPLIWMTVSKTTLKNKRNDHEYRLLERLHDCVAPDVKITVLADRGFGDQKLYRFLQTLGWDFVIRFRGAIQVEDATGTRKTANAWVPDNGRALILRGARVRDARTTRTTTERTRRSTMHTSRPSWAPATGLDHDH